MSGVYEKKRQFVENELNACLKAADIGVDHLEYVRNEETGEEIITIFYVGYGRRRINVSADSRLAMIYDVLRWGEF